MRQQEKEGHVHISGCWKEKIATFENLNASRGRCEIWDLTPGAGITKFCFGSKSSYGGARRSGLEVVCRAGRNLEWKVLRLSDRLLRRLCAYTDADDMLDVRCVRTRRLGKRLVHLPRVFDLRVLEPLRRRDDTNRALVLVTGLS